MNVQQFIDHKTTCPICNNKVLNFSFISKKQILHRDGDNLLVIFDLNPIKKGQKRYKVGYSINKITNRFHIEFYESDSIDEKYYNEVPLFLMDRFVNFHENQHEFKLYKECFICKTYSYQSQYFKLDLLKHEIEDIQIESESFSYLHRYNNKQYSIVVRNYEDKSSFNVVWRLNILGYNKTKEFALTDVARLDCSDLDKLGDRLINLMLFS